MNARALLIGPLLEPTLRNFTPDRTSVTPSGTMTVIHLRSAALMSFTHDSKPHLARSATLGGVGAV
jgi:hypothetical protein